MYEKERAIDYAKKQLDYWTARNRVTDGNFEEVIKDWNAILRSLRERSKIEKLKVKLEQVRRDAKFLESSEAIAMDYVIDLTIEILEE